MSRLRASRFTGLRIMSNKCRLKSGTRRSAHTQNFVPVAGIDQAGRLKWSIIPSNCSPTLAYSETCIDIEFLRLSGNCSRLGTVMIFLKSWLIQDLTRTLEIACTYQSRFTKKYLNLC